MGRMKAQLSPPDSHHLLAAAGWLELGNPQEALLELNRIAPALTDNFFVLEMAWALHATQNNWVEALPIALRLVELHPDESTSWLHYAYALRRAPEGSVEKAWQALFPAAEKFPDESTIPFNLACYACQLGEFDNARMWLQKAMKTGGAKEIRGRALQDEDLRKLWPEIQGW